MLGNDGDDASRMLLVWFASAACSAVMPSMKDLRVQSEELILSPSETPTPLLGLAVLHYLGLAALRCILFVWMACCVVRIGYRLVKDFFVCAHPGTPNAPAIPFEWSPSATRFDSRQPSRGGPARRVTRRMS